MFHPLIFCFIFDLRSYGADHLVTATFVQAQNRGPKICKINTNPKIAASVFATVKRAY